MFIEKIHLNS